MKTLTRLDVDTKTGDHDRFAHYTVDPFQPGQVNRALCGKTWIPDRRGLPTDPFCSTCRAFVEGDA